MLNITTTPLYLKPNTGIVDMCLALIREFVYCMAAAWWQHHKHFLFLWLLLLLYIVIIMQIFKYFPYFEVTTVIFFNVLCTAVYCAGAMVWVTAELFPLLFNEDENTEKLLIGQLYVILFIFMTPVMLYQLVMASCKKHRSVFLGVSLKWLSLIHVITLL